MNELKKRLYSKDFKEFFDTKLKKKARYLEKKRKKCVKKLKFIFTFMFVSLVLPCFSIFFNGYNNIAIFFLLQLGTLFTFVFFAAALLAGGRIIYLFKKEAKELLIKETLSFFGNFQIKELKQKFNKDLHNLYLFQGTALCGYTERISGTYNSIEVDIKEMLSPFKLEGHNNNAPSSHNVISCLVITIPSFKKFKGATIIQNKIIHGLPLFNNRLESVRLEDPEYNNYYNTYSKNQIEARYLITPAFMKRLNKLAKTKRPLCLSFEKGKITFITFLKKNQKFYTPDNSNGFQAFDMTDNFEISLFQPVNIESLRETMMDLVEIFELIDVLKLEQNIGM